MSLALLFSLVQPLLSSPCKKPFFHVGSKVSLMASLGPEASEYMKESRPHSKPEAAFELQGAYMGMKEAVYLV